MQHERAEHDVELAIGKRKRLDDRSTEVDGDAAFLAWRAQSSRGTHRYHGRSRLGPHVLRGDGEAPPSRSRRPARTPRLKACELDEPFAERALPTEGEQPYHEVVEARGGAHHRHLALAPLSLIVDVIRCLGWSSYRSVVTTINVRTLS